MNDSMNIVQFKFANKTFSFPQETISMYTWLNKMCGNGMIGTPKDKLDYDLTEFLQVSPSVLRNMCIILEHIQNNTEDDPFINNSLLEKTEHFLKFGPGCTKGLDIMYECSKCEFQTLDPTQENTKCIQEPMHHRLVVIHSGAQSCSYCGVTFPMDKPFICPINDIPHRWK